MPLDHSNLNPAPAHRTVPTILRTLVQRIHSDQGTVAVSFILALPIFLIILAILVQYALLINAKIMLDQTAISAGRTAATCLPTDVQLDNVIAEDNINRTAYIQLVPLSPVARGGTNAESQVVAQAFTNAGVQLPAKFAERYTYAAEATAVSYPQRNYAASNGQDLELQVSYKFYLTVPGAQRLIGNADTVGGISGRFITLFSTTQVQTAHGRQAATAN